MHERLSVCLRECLYYFLIHISAYFPRSPGQETQIFMKLCWIIVGVTDAFELLKERERV